MNKQLTLSQYRGSDLTILAVVLTFTQVLTVAAATIWFRDQLYIVSPVASVVTLALMRWGPWAAIQAVLGGIVFAVASGGEAEHILIYSVGNLLSLAVLVYLRGPNKEKIRLNGTLSVLTALAVQLLMLAGRAAVAAALRHPLSVCLGFITTDFLSVLLTMVVIWVARKADGLFEDQKHYLLRVQRERENERRDQF